MSEVSTVYGPVNSWRLGRSLGVDLLCVNSICSFRCVYCQLGRINVHTAERRVFVPTRKVLEDLGRSAWREADCVTLSGSGEPTLAENLGEVICGIKLLTSKPVIVLTNSTRLTDAQVRRELCGADAIFCKLDAADEKTFRRINRPVEGVTLRTVVEGIKKLRAEYAGHLAIQFMLTPLNIGKCAELARILLEVRPNKVQINTPSRPVAREWFLAARGNLRVDAACGSRLKQLTSSDVARFAQEVARLTNLKVNARAQSCAS
ncbi:MAG TPA: radical SAM protein [Pyrinomonadaceae bacterium]|nr:radical SAM protein [Pyrinomonadaceae bacterium]